MSHVYEIGGWAFGIRTNSEAVAGWLDDCLGAYRIDDPEVDPYYSILAEPGAREGPVRRYNILYRETRKIARSFDLAGIGRTLLTELESYLFAERDDALYADTVVIAKNGATALIPADIAQYVDTLGRKVDRAGLTLPADTKVAIDPRSGAVTPIEPMLNVPADALDRLAAIGGGNGRDNRLILDRAVAVNTVFSVGESDELLQPVLPGVALFRLATHVVNMRKLGQTGLDALRRTIDGARCYEVTAGGPANVLDAVARTFDPA